jgi:hypothetical protein
MSLLPGRYYIGDPCYALSKERHKQFLDLIGCNDEAQKLLQGGVLEGEFNLPDGIRFAVYNTLWGDGRYRSNFGDIYPVDSGCIACIPIELDEMGAVADGLGTEHVLSAGCTHTRSDCNRRTGVGLMVFGPVEIETGDDSDDDEE